MVRKSVLIRPKYRDNGQSATKPTSVGRLTDFKGWCVSEYIAQIESRASVKVDVSYLK